LLPTRPGSRLPGIPVLSLALVVDLSTWDVSRCQLASVEILKGRVAVKERADFFEKKTCGKVVDRKWTTVKMMWKRDGVARRPWLARHSTCHLKPG